MSDGWMVYDGGVLFGSCMIYYGCRGRGVCGMITKKPGN